MRGINAAARRSRRLTVDNKITKTRLNDHLSYDWGKYFGLIAAAVFLLAFVFTVTAPRLSKGQTLEIYLLGRGYGTAATNASADILGVLTPGETFEVSIQAYDLTDPNMQQAYSVRIAAGEGDIMVGTRPTLLGAVDNGIFAPLGDELAAAAALSDFDGDTQAGRDEFKAFSGKKYKEKDAEKLLRDLAAENARRAHYRQNAVKLLGYLELIPELKVEYARGTLYNSLIESGDLTGDPMTVGESKLWAVSFEPLIAAMAEDGFIYPKENPTEEEIEAGENVFGIGLVGFKPANEPYFYETLAVINHLIEKYAGSALD